ncbi:MAG TPA: PilN domain-containing protein [Pyrinomonadaceae bacterium]|nr:PilN domain-containing protein [Pyrinomonadaceae bacterium]
MSNNLNLASKPFSNRLLPWVLTAVILFISVVGLVVVIQLTTSINRDVASRSASVNKMKQDEQDLITKGEELKRQFSIDKQQALQAAHQLVDRKGFAWSRLFADLEDAVPDNVRVSRIAVRDITRQGDQTVADLDLAVFSKSSTSVLQMMSDMNKSGIFDAKLVNQNLQKGRGESGSEFELAVVYRPRHGVASESVAEVREDKAEAAK